MHENIEASTSVPPLAAASAPSIVLRETINGAAAVRQCILAPPFPKKVHAPLPEYNSSQELLMRNFMTSMQDFMIRHCTSANILSWIKEAGADEWCRCIQAVMEGMAIQKKKSPDLAPERAEHITQVGQCGELMFRIMLPKFIQSFGRESLNILTGSPGTLLRFPNCIGCFGHTDNMKLYRTENMARTNR
jgi:hypothetical protein